MRVIMRDAGADLILVAVDETRWIGLDCFHGRFPPVPIYASSG